MPPAMKALESKKDDVSKAITAVTCSIRFGGVAHTLWWWTSLRKSPPFAETELRRCDFMQQSTKTYVPEVRMTRKEERDYEGVEGRKKKGESRQ